MVFSVMLPSRYGHEIFFPIIIPDAVDVVNFLIH